MSLLRKTHQFTWQVRLLISLLLVVSFSMSAATFDGVGSANYSSPEQQTQAIQTAEANAINNAIRNYLTKKEASLLRFYDEKNLGEKILQKQNHYIAAKKQVSQEVTDIKVTTTLRVKINGSAVEQLIRKHSVVANVSDEERSSLAIVFVARQQNDGDQYAELSVNDDVETPVKDLFQNAGYRVMSGYQFQKLTGNVFNKSLLSKGYARAGKVDWNKAELAAMMSDTEQSGLYMVIGTFDVIVLPEDDMTGMQQVKVEAKGRIVDPYSYQSLTEKSASDRALGMSQTDAINSALKKAGKKLGEKMVGFLYAEKIY